MTPAARVAAAIAVLDQIIAGEPAERALISWARANRYAGSGDRAAVRDRVFDALRRRGEYAHLGHALSGRGLMIGALRAAAEDLQAIFSGAAYAPPALTEAERAAPAPLPDDGPARWNLPAPLIAAFRASLGDQADSAMAALSQRADVHLRVNTRKGSREKAQAALAAEEIETRPHDSVETALIVTKNARKVQNAQAYLQGLVELQDAASQAAILRLPLSDGMRVLDYCAGGGGKSLAMGARARLDIAAHDAAPARMADLPARAARAGLKIRQIGPADVARSGPYDLVLIDAPCSGSGTWRRTPDAKWRFEDKDLQALVRVQSEILPKAARLVTAGGVLAYATCSVLQGENDAQIAAFCAAHPRWQQTDRMQLLPGPDWDGFYLSVLRHQA
ncbi:RsmB/NOP family class I SAM-dependent RNA methyltransferase [Ketogulonicigenium vulgare]|uniref:RsmB/NOP family class I SAM-dependent RNA methyltransferase n=1 Tax=Ketogulonicigenium vulgare TaxID=92945 RepID=UPI002358EDC6|nr:RsmB/NOP family class I SAM-dependent RNA methyltransferase [Ketogulonicigenium vulgare]